MFLRHVLFAFLYAFTAASAAAQERTVITVPISAALDDVQARIGEALPGTLHQATTAQRCVEPGRACTKVPEFRGLEVTFRNRCVEVTPAIDCSIDHRVWREGRLRLSGEGTALTLHQVVRAQATVRGRGEIGRHIQETVNGAAEFTITATPRVLPDWSLDMPPPSVSFRWTDRPNVMLFDVIRITFGTEAERALNDAISRFRSETLPAELAKIDLRSEIAEVWRRLHEPQRIDLPDGQALWLHFRPDAVGLAPLTVADGRIATMESIAGKARVTDSRVTPFSRAYRPLPDLTPVPPGGVSVVVPVTVGLDTLSESLRAKLPHTVTLEDLVAGSITVRSANVAAEGARLILRLVVQAETLGVGAYSGPLTVSGIPRWNANTQVLTFNDPQVRADGRGMATFLVNDILSSQRFDSWLEEQVTTSLQAQIAEAEAELDGALNRDLSSDLRLTTDLRLRVEGLKLDDAALSLTARATGTTEVVGLTSR